MQRLSPFLFMASLLITISSCRPIYRIVLGIDSTPQWRNQEETKKDFQKRGIPLEQAYVLDTASYRRAVIEGFEDQLAAMKSDTLPFDTAAADRLVKYTKDNLQPVQIRYFDWEGKPIFKLVNCYIDPPIPINWNVNGCFDTFPPRYPAPELKEQNQNLAYFLPHIRNHKGESTQIENLPEADYYALVFWNNFMKRPSKRLLSTLEKYAEDHPNSNTYFLYVYNHNAVLWSAMDAKSREEVLNE